MKVLLLPLAETVTAGGGLVSLTQRCLVSCISQAALPGVLGIPSDLLRALCSAAV